VRGASIGPVTSEAARALGVPIEIEAAESSIASLVQSIVAHLSVSVSTSAHAVR
jgi:uroporphyrinogen-III synthase